MWLALALIASILAPARAQPAEEASPAPLALVVSGGVSLGTYEAGYLYYLVEAARRNPQAVEIKVITGTSAGSINAMLAALSYCGMPASDPRRSLFYRVWLPIGYDELYVPEDATPRSAFSRRAFRDGASALRKLYEHGFRKDCDMLLGFTTTRVTPARTRVGALAEIAYGEERFAVRVQGLGFGQPPSVASWLLPDNALPQPVLPLDGEDADPFASLLEVVFASAAYPVAFEPMPVKFCSVLGNQVVEPCTRANADEVELVDGAMFDNTPLRLAVDLAEASAQHDHRLAGPDPSGESPNRAVFAMLPADAMPWPRPSSADLVSRSPSSTLALIGAIGSGFVEIAQQTELRVVLDEHPEILGTMSMLRGVLPSHGDALWWFGGFFEQGFREADFVQGMVAAHLNVKHASRTWMGLEEAASLTLPGEGDRAGWRAFDCLVGVLEGSSTASCAHPEVAPLRPLFQVAIDRLYAECAVLGDREVDPASISDARCRDAMLAGVPPLIPGQPRPVDSVWRLKPGEDWLDHQLRRLHAHGFAWVDEGLGVARASVAKRHLRDRLSEPAVAVARANDNGRQVVRLLSELGLDQVVAYGSPRSFAWVGLGAQLETGFSSRLGSGWREWVRVGGAVSIDGIYRPLRSQGAFFAATPMLDVQLELFDLSTGILQPRLGAQFGYRFSSADGFGSRGCDTDAVCTQPAIHVNGGVSLFQRMRLQMGVGFFPSGPGGQPFAVQLLPQIAVQFPTTR